MNTHIGDLISADQTTSSRPEVVRRTPVSQENHDEFEQMFDLIWNELCHANGITQAHGYLYRDLSIYVGGHSGKILSETLGDAFYNDVLMIHNIFVELGRQGFSVPKEKIGYHPKKW